MKLLVRYLRERPLPVWHEFSRSYSKDGKGKPIGVVVASFNEETRSIRLGWSLCSKRDTFNKAKAKQIAIGRMNAAHSAEPHPDILPLYLAVAELAISYFKDAIGVD